MNTSVSGRSFSVALRIKQRHQDMAASIEAVPDLRLPRIRLCEIASAAGLDAVRRALDEMFADGQMSG